MWIGLTPVVCLREVDAHFLSCFLALSVEGGLACVDLVGVAETALEEVLNISDRFPLEEIVTSMLELMTLPIVDEQLCIIDYEHLCELLLLTEHSV